MPRLSQRQFTDFRRPKLPPAVSGWDSAVRNRTGNQLEPIGRAIRSSTEAAMDRLLLDLRLALRRLLQNPGFSLIAISTLALGIGANTAIFSAINAVIFRPLPVERGSELISVNETQGGETYPTLSYPNYLDMRDRNQVLSGLIAYRFLPASLGLPGNSQRVWGYLVTGNYFQVLGVRRSRGASCCRKTTSIAAGIQWWC